MTMKTQYQVDVITEDGRNGYKNVDVDFDGDWIVIDTGDYDYDSNAPLRVMIPREKVVEIRGVSDVYEM